MFYSFRVDVYYLMISYLTYFWHTLPKCHWQSVQRHSFLLLEQES